MINTGLGLIRSISCPTVSIGIDVSKYRNTTVDHPGKWTDLQKRCKDSYFIVGIPLCLNYDQLFSELPIAWLSTKGTNVVPAVGPKPDGNPRPERRNLLNNFIIIARCVKNSWLH